MTPEERVSFNEADKQVHPVETQWHYDIMTKYGYTPITKEGIGFVRSYIYVHPTKSERFGLTTGRHADYWAEVGTNHSGYWGTLEARLKELDARPPSN